MKVLEKIMMPTMVLLVAACVGALPAQESQEEAVDLAKEAVIQETERDVDPSSIRVRRAEPVQWPDTSLGCPKEGMMYSQVITPGYRIFLDVDVLTYQVHVGGGRAIVCNEPIDRTGAKELPERTPARKPSSVEGEVPEKIIEDIRKDLGKRLSVEPGELNVVEAESLIWDDGSLGCPKPGQIYSQAPVEGYRVILEHQDKKYDYRATTKGRILLCQTPSRPRPRPRERKPDPDVTPPR